MTTPSRIVLLTLCAILTGIDLTSGFILNKPKGECPIFPQGIRCLSRAPDEFTCRDDSDCFKKKCCYNGCSHICMDVSVGLPVVPTDPPFERPFRPPVKPKIPFPYDPYHKFPPSKPLPDFQPDFPPEWFPPMDPPNIRHDEANFPDFPGEQFDNFP